MATTKEISFPYEVKVGSAAGTIYYTKHPCTASGMIHTAKSGKWRCQRAKFEKAESELKLYLAKLNAGEVAAAGMTKEDRDELLTLRKLAGDTPPSVAIKEWKYEQDRQAEARTGCTPATVEDVIDRFIKDGEANGRQHERTYRSKLSSLLLPTEDDGTGNDTRRPTRDSFVGRHIHTIAKEELAARLQAFQDHVTRNDYRKKAGTLWGWAKAAGHIPKDRELAPGATMRAVEGETDIEICTPESYAKLLMYMQDYHPQYLAATVLAGLAWMRVEEVSGKRGRREQRQLWSDIHLDPDVAKEDPFLNVSFAKRNTPANRKCPLPPAAVAWLRTIPEAGRTGYVCPRFALQRVRAIGKLSPAGLKPATTGRVKTSHPEGMVFMRDKRWRTRSN